MDLTCSAKLVLKQTWEELKEAGTNLPGQSIVYIYIPMTQTVPQNCVTWHLHCFRKTAALRSLNWTKISHAPADLCHEFLKETAVLCSYQLTTLTWSHVGQQNYNR